MLLFLYLTLMSYFVVYISLHSWTEPDSKQVIKDGMKEIINVETKGKEKIWRKVEVTERKKNEWELRKLQSQKKKPTF